jgi:hypothetical protein
LGAGQYTDRNDPEVKRCKRLTGSYPFQVKLPFPHIEDKNFHFEACSGDTLDGIDKQITNLAGTEAQIITLSISDNNLKFSSVVENCVYNVFALTDTKADQDCTQALSDASKLVDDESIWSLYKQKVNDIMDKVAIADITGIPIPWSVLAITGYPKFWGEVENGDTCSTTRFTVTTDVLGVPVTKKGNLMKESVRSSMNLLVERVNSKIQSEILPINRDKIVFVDVDAQYEGHRFCEKGVTDDPIGPKSDKVWFISIDTPLLETEFVPDPNSALEAQWSALAQNLSTSINFLPNELRINSNFHPKTAGNTQTAQAVQKTVQNWGNTHEHTPSPPPQACIGSNAGDLPQKIVVNPGIVDNPNGILYRLCRSKFLAVFDLGYDYHC